MPPTKRKLSERLPPFAAIYNEEMLSAAYIALKPSAAKAYPHFKRFHGIRKKIEKRDHPIFNFTYAEAVKLGFSKRTFSTIIEDLNDKGFINIVDQGGMRGCGLSNSKYQLSERWREYGKKPIYDYVTGKVRAGFMHKARYRTEPPPERSY